MKVALAFCVLVTSLCSSCVVAAVGAAAGGAAGFLYTQGELRGASLAAPPELVAAAIEVLDELEVTIDASDATAVDGFVEGRTATGKDIRIVVVAKGERSRLGIRVDRFGDASLSERIFEGLRTRIGEGRLLTLSEAREADKLAAQREAERELKREARREARLAARQEEPAPLVEAD